MNEKNEEINKLIKKLLRQLNKYFKITLDDVKRSILKHSVKLAEPFNNFNVALMSEIKEAFEKLQQNILAIINTSVDGAISSAEQKLIQDIQSHFSKIKNVVADYSKSDLMAIVPKFENRPLNHKAYNAFINRLNNGVSLSDRVWKITRQAKSVVEFTLKSGILEGKSAAEMARILSESLNNPDKLFRRVRNQSGNLETSKNAKLYNPGKGVYRSSYKNALRLAATETNMAYHFAEFERIQQIPSIIGFRVVLSGSHKIYDICDRFEGEYRKDFCFIGWHPLCMCSTRTIFLSDEDFKKYLQTGVIKSISYIKTIPEEASAFLKSKSDKLTEIKNKPYWLRQNAKIVSDVTGVSMEKLAQGTKSGSITA